MTMDERDALFRAILADPDSDSLRERYAQASERHGDSERARFIRLQLDAAVCLRHNEPHWNAAVEARELAAKDGHWTLWAGPLAGKVESYEFYRGFVEKVRIDAREFLHRADDLFESAPLRRLSLTNVLPVMAELFESPHLSRIVSLTLEYQHIGDRGAELIAASPYLGKLAWLALGGNGIMRDGLTALMKTDAFPALRYVDLAGNPVYDDVGPEYEDDQGHMVMLVDDLWPIEKQLGRKPWLHTVRDFGRSFESESAY